MYSTTLKEVLQGTEHTLPLSVDPENTVKITLPDEITEDSSLVFFTERISSPDQSVTMDFKGEKPLAAVVNKNRDVINSPVPIIRVNSVRKALSYAYSNAYRIDYSRLKIIAVTGTNGKTTTATIIFEMLRSIGYSAGFIGTGKICINERTITPDTYSMTTPDPSVLYSALSSMQNEKCEYVVMEVSSHSIALGKVSPIKFKYAIFTNLSNEHMDFHTDIVSYYKTKLSLFEQSEHGLFNLDDRYSRRAFNEVTCKKSSVGIIQEAETYITDINTASVDKSFFYYRTRDLTFGVKSKLCGVHNIYNSLLALKCLIDLGIRPCIAKQAFEKINYIEGRTEFIKSDINAVIDYAHTSEAFYNLAKSLVSSDIYKQNLTVIFGCGGNRDKSKRSAMGKIAEKYADKIILTEDNNRNESFSDIISDIAKGIEYKEYRVIRNRESAIRAAIREAAVGDIIAVIGKGHEKYKTENGITTSFDEKAIIKDALKKRSEMNANKP